MPVRSNQKDDFVHYLKSAICTQLIVWLCIIIIIPISDPENWFPVRAKTKKGGVPTEIVRPKIVFCKRRLTSKLVFVEHWKEVNYFAKTEITVYSRSQIQRKSWSQLTF